MVLLAASTAGTLNFERSAFFLNAKPTNRQEYALGEEEKDKDA
jgi:hypothetical protein